MREPNVCYCIRKNTSDTDCYYYNNRFVILHDILRDLAIYQSTQEQTEQRKRLMIDMDENKPEGWLREKQQGIMIRFWSNIFGWCIEQKPQHSYSDIVNINRLVITFFEV